MKTRASGGEAAAMREERSDGRTHAWRLRCTTRQTPASHAMLSISAAQPACFADTTPRPHRLTTVRRSWTQEEMASPYLRLISRALVGVWMQPIMQISFPSRACSAHARNDNPAADEEEHIAPESAAENQADPSHSQQLQLYFTSFVPSPAAPSSPAHSAPLIAPSPIRRLQSSLRALGWLPVTHSVFSARDGPAAVESAARGVVMVLLSSAVFVGGWHLAHLGWTSFTTRIQHGARTMLRMQPRPKLAVVHGSDAANAAAAAARTAHKIAERLLPPAAAQRVFDLLQQLRALDGGPALALQFAAYSALVLGSVAAFSLSLGVARVFGWVAPSRDSYTDISGAMRQASYPFTARQATALDLPPLVRTSAQRRAGWIKHLHPFFSRIWVGPYIEELFLSTAVSPLLSLLSLLPGFHRVPVLALRVLLVGGLSASIHPARKAPSAAAAAAVSTVLCAVSPFSSLLLPTLFHACLNYLACDAYAAISPLRGLQLEPEPEGDGAQQQPLRWSTTPAAQAASQQLRAELLHFCDPTARATLLRLAVLVRTTPLLRLLAPSRKHPMFRQPSHQKHTLSSPSSPPPPLSLDPAVPAGRCALSTRYCSVVGALFTMLDHEQRGYLSARSLGFLLLLWPSNLELLRGAFATIDAELATSELEARIAQLQAARDAEANEAAAGRARTTRAEQASNYSRAFLALEAEVLPLEPQVIHVARQMDQARSQADRTESVHAVAASRPFPCAEWMGVDTRGGSRDNPADYTSLTPERRAALEFLLHRMQVSGAHLDAPALAAAANSDEPLDALGWQLDGAALLARRLGVPVAAALDPGPAPALAPRQQRRFQRLAKKFEAYANMMQGALWEANLSAYGEEVADDDDAGAAEESKESAEEKAPQPIRPTTRRFTCRSLYALLRDSALLDVEGTDALMAHATLVLSGRMPHPMQLFNVCVDTFQPKQRSQRR